jgi:hypothetical protein
MDTHSAYADRINKLEAAAKALGHSIDALTRDKTGNVNEVQTTLSPRESAELNLALAKALVSLVDANFTSQGIASSRHAITREKMRLDTYIGKLSSLNLSDEGESSSDS